MGTLKECGRWQSSSKQKKHTAFFFANKGEKKKTLLSQHCILEHILSRVPPGEPKEEKSIKTRLSTTKQWCRVTLQVSKPQSQKIRTSGQTTWENGYQKNTKQLLGNELKARQIPRGRSSKNTWRAHWSRDWNNVTKQQTAGQQLLANTGLGLQMQGGQVSKQLHKHPRGLHSGEEAAGTSCRPNMTARAAWRGHTAPAHKDPLLQETHCSATRSGSGH